MFFRNFALIFVAVNRLFFAHGQTTHTVTVGLLGSFYDPPTVSAEVNDTVTFVFAGPGVAGIGTNDTSIPSPTWSIRITNASQPIWYFCEITTPSSHCAAGMVGAINPPNVSDYLQFAAAAKLVTGTPARCFNWGWGLCYSESGDVLDRSSHLIIFNVFVNRILNVCYFIFSQAAITTPSQSSTKSHLGAIIGGAAGGGIGVIIFLIVLLWYCGRRKSTIEPLSPSTDDSHFFRYNPGPVRRPSDAFVAAKAWRIPVSQRFHMDIIPPSAPLLLHGYSNPKHRKVLNDKPLFFIDSGPAFPFREAVHWHHQHAGVGE
ncbi:hypothetical protein BDZ97DRAFT_1758767 [Flammula alnicola]|nr:hypothetical protein BDZ97DRAFT_1758767 [Flammula alnicola]